MHKFFAKKIINNLVSFNYDDENHIIKVLRYKVGQELIVNFNNERFLCCIVSIKPLRAKIIKKLVINENNFILNVYIASIKIPSIELAIKKSVELGVNSFNIFYASLSQKNIKHNLDRYYKIVESCSKQSNRNKLMDIKIIDDITNKIKINDINLVADFNDNSTNLVELINSKKTNSIGIIIGPEGGFSTEDLIKLKSNNTYIINLTNTILRSETALIYVVSVIDFLMKG